MDGDGPHGQASGQYFEKRPVVGSRRGSVRLELPNLGPLQLLTDRGVFSSSRIDPGTAIMLRHIPVPEEGDLLDLGCGYGPIALVLATRSPRATVWAVDVNERARELTAENARNARLTNVIVASPEEVGADLRFAGVYSNPPIRIGKTALHELLDRWLGRLVPGSSAWLVVQRHLGADSLHRWLVEHGHEVTRRRSSRGYRLLEVTPRRSAPSPVEPH